MRMLIVTNKRGPGLENGHFDESAALHALDGERELLSQLATMFVEDAPELLTTLEQAVAAGDCSMARRTTHSLKGLASTFYATPTVELAQRLEHEAADGRLNEFTEGGCSQLRRAIESLEQELRTHGLVL